MARPKKCSDEQIRGIHKRFDGGEMLKNVCAEYGITARQYHRRLKMLGKKRARKGKKSRR